MDSEVSEFKTWPLHLLSVRTTLLLAMWWLPVGTSEPLDLASSLFQTLGLLRSHRLPRSYHLFIPVLKQEHKGHPSHTVCTPKSHQ